MTNGNTFSSMLIVLAMFVVLYFAAVGIFELKKYITEKFKKKKFDDTELRQNTEGHTEKMSD